MPDKYKGIDNNYNLGNIYSMFGTVHSSPFPLVGKLDRITKLLDKVNYDSKVKTSGFTSPQSESTSSDTKSNTTGTSKTPPPPSPLPFSLVGGAVGATLGGLGEIFSMISTQDRLKKAINSLDELKYDSKEKEEELDKVGDAYNTQVMNQFNSSAFNLSGILNSNTLRALQSSQLLGQRASALLAKEQEMDKYNKELEMQKIQLKAGTDTSFNFGNVFSSILSGAMIGDKIK